MSVYIYVIKCPTTNLVRYVGKTNNPKERFRKHLCEKKHTKKCWWIYNLKQEGLKPLFEIIDECSQENWQEKERDYIRLFKSIGANLLNQLPGGEGGATMQGRNLTAEQRKKISDSKIGKPRPEVGLNNKMKLGTKVNQYDLSGNYITTHLSIKDAGRAIGRSDRRIYNMVTGKGGKTVNQVGGYRFSIA